MKALYTTGRALAASSLLMVFACVHAADGFIVRADQEGLIKPGMTRDEVQSKLGKPSKNVKYPNEPGRTWTYEVSGKTLPLVVFDVDFGPDGKVMSSSERILPEDKPGAY